jgi:pimeloyl-ACP methyl ester carboxylesterase
VSNIDLLCPKVGKGCLIYGSVAKDRAQFRTFVRVGSIRKSLLLISAIMASHLARGAKVKDQTIKTNGINMHFVEHGNGPLILLCHGFPETSHSWRHQLPALANAGFRAVAPDLRGYGETDRPEQIDQYTLFHLIGDMVGLLDALGEEHALIVGNDWGATLAWHAALMRPDRFRGVIALSVPMMAQPPIRPTMIFPQSETALFYILYFQSPGVAELELERDISLSLRKIFFALSGDAGLQKGNDDTTNPLSMMVSRTDGFLATLPDPSSLPSWLTDADLRIYAEAFAKSGFRGPLNYYRNIDRNFELMAAIKGVKVTVPALFLVGEKHVGFRGMTQMISDMSNMVPMLEDSIVLPGIGHWVQEENPESVNSAIISFAKTRF